MTTKKVGRFDYLIAGILALLGIFFFSMNAITVGIVFLAALGFWVYASPRIYPKYSLGLTGMGKVAFAAIVLFGFVVGAINDADRVKPPSPGEIAQREAQRAKADYIEAIEDASKYVSEVNVSESETEIHINIDNVWSEGKYLNKAGQAMYDITRDIYEDVHKYADNQLLFVLHAPFQSGQERTATITYRPDAIQSNVWLFEKEMPYQPFLDIADRVISHQGQVGKRYLTAWCEDADKASGAELFCQKARQ